MTRTQIVAESWACDDKQGARASRTELRCRALLDWLDWRVRWIGTDRRTNAENVAAGSANAAARADTRHGSPLGGSRRQRHIARTRGRRALRLLLRARRLEADECPF